MGPTSLKMACPHWGQARLQGAPVAPSSGDALHPPMPLYACLSPLICMAPVLSKLLPNCPGLGQRLLAPIADVEQSSEDLLRASLACRHSQLPIWQSH